MDGARVLSATTRRPAHRLGGDVVEDALSGQLIRLVYNGRWEEGLSGSLRAGLQAMPESVSGTFLVLADQR